MPGPLIRRIIFCLAIASPAIVFRVTGFAPNPVLGLIVFGAAVVASSFMLAWAAEAAQKDISGALAIAILALIAVLPEYAVDLFYAFRSGSDPAYEQFAAANMTGSNRLLLGVGWPLVVLVALFVARRGARSRGANGKSVPRVLRLPGSSRLDVGVLAIVSVLAFAIPIMGHIAIWFGILLIAIFAAYLWKAGRAANEEHDEEFVGQAANIANMPTSARRWTFSGIFVASAAIILLSAEPFATALVDSGSKFGIDSFFLVQWLAPLASEAPEFIVAVLSAGHSTAPLVSNTRTFHDVAEAALKADAATRKQKTLNGYEVALRVHIYPTFGARRISTVSAEQVQTWLAELRSKPKANGAPRSETSVLGTYKALAKVFGYAMRHRLLTYNPCDAVDKPRADTQEAHFLSSAEVETLARHLDREPPYGLMVRLTAYTGLRAGELAALRIRDVDLLHKEVRVHLNMTHTSAGYVTDVPKTANSKREVPILVDSLLADLAEYLAQHPYRANPDAGLWPGKVKGHPVLTYERPFDPKGFYRYTFKPAAAAVGVPSLKLHELRHTFATLVLESGAFDMFELSRLLGHASVSITDRVYAHLRKKDYSDQRARFSAFLAGSTATPTERPAARIG